MRSIPSESWRFSTTVRTRRAKSRKARWNACAKPSSVGEKNAKRLTAQQEVQEPKKKTQRRVHRVRSTEVPEKNGDTGKQIDGEKRGRAPGAGQGPGRGPVRLGKSRRARRRFGRAAAGRSLGHQRRSQRSRNGIGAGGKRRGSVRLGKRGLQSSHPDVRRSARPFIGSHSPAEDEHPRHSNFFDYRAIFGLPAQTRRIGRGRFRGIYLYGD